MSVTLHRLRRRSTRKTFLLVPLLLMHLLIPQGFMPVAAAHGFIGLCPDAAALPPGLALPGHAHHHADPGPRRAGHVPCLFTLGVALAGTPAAPALVLHHLPQHAATVADAAARFVPTILRAQSPRAPPRLAL